MGKHINHRGTIHKYQLFKTLYNDWTIAAIMKRLEISKVTYQQFFEKAVMEDLKEPERPITFNVHAKPAFSENEDDYGTKTRWGFQIENSPITKKETTELEVAIKAYKANFKL